MYSGRLWAKRWTEIKTDKDGQRFREGPSEALGKT